MKTIRLILTVCILSCVAFHAASATTREERSHVAQGNALYGKGDYAGAKAEYEAALKINNGNLTARYNYALSRIRLAAAKDKPENAAQMFKDAMSDLSTVVAASAENPSLAAKAAYNMGNIAFNQQDYQSAAAHYKDALRLNPDHEKSRRNLRITQKKMQQNQNQDQNQNKDQNKDKDKNKDQNKNQDQNKDQDKNQDRQNDRDKIDRQSADRILNAVENKENSTRSRMEGKKGRNENSSRHPLKNW